MDGAAQPDLRPARIALVTVEFPPTVGGVATSSARLARTLAAEGYDVSVIVPLFASGGTARQRRECGCNVYELPIDLAGGMQRGTTQYLKSLKHLDRKIRFDFFHSFFLLSAFPCALLAGTARPLLVSIRGGDMATQYHGGFKAGALYSLKQAAWVTSVNKCYLDTINTLINLDGRCSVLLNGVEIPQTTRRWSLDNARAGEVGMVGQFSRVKDVPLLVRAFSALTAQPGGADPRLHLFGRFVDAREEQWSGVLADELGAADRIVFHGEMRRSEIVGQLSKLRVYVQCSASEGLPNALLEAAAVGVPLVATDVGGMGEVLRHEDNALLVPHGDPAALAAAIARVLSDDHLAIHLSKGSRRLASDLSAEREQTAWLDLYRRLGMPPRVA